MLTLLCSSSPRRSASPRRPRIRTIADIPPETEDERRERERFERELAERERREGGRGGRERPQGAPSGLPKPPPGLLGSWEFREDQLPPVRRWAGQERTPSLSPEQGEGDVGIEGMPSL